MSPSLVCISTDAVNGDYIDREAFERTRRGLGLEAAGLEFEEAVRLFLVGFGLFRGGRGATASGWAPRCGRQLCPSRGASAFKDFVHETIDVLHG